MPSPVGHSLGAVALVPLLRKLRLVPPRQTPDPSSGARLDVRGMVNTLYWSFWLVVGANVPDLDFIPGIFMGEPDRFHHGPAHSLGGAILFGGFVWLLMRRYRPRQAMGIGIMMGLAFVSHLALDMCSIDRRLPNGVPLFWPISSQYVVLPFPVFLDIQRDPRASNFFVSLLQKHNVIAMLWEFVVMGLVLAVMRAWMLVAGGLRMRAERRAALGDRACPPTSR